MEMGVDLLEVITSIKNSIVKEIVKLKNKKYRYESELFIVEGKRSVKEIPQNWNIEKLIITDTFEFDYDEFTNLKNVRTFVVSEIVMNKMTETVNSSGIICVCSMKNHHLDEVLNADNPFIIICENISDPGNLGALIRTADAAGSSGVILTNSCVDLYNPKVIRSSMGSIFHIPVIADVDTDKLFQLLDDNKIRTYGTSVNTENTLYSQSFSEPSAILIGNEANGLSQETIDKCNSIFKIPMHGNAESLNASVAFGVVAFEVVRQRELTN